MLELFTVIIVILSIWWLYRLHTDATKATKRFHDLLDEADTQF